MEVMFFCIKMIVFLHFLTISVFHMIIYKYLGKKDLRKDDYEKGYNFVFMYFVISVQRML